MKDLSIIIPHYNTYKLLSKLISSIPDIDEIEILVVDDNSNDGFDPLKLTNEMQRKNLQIFRNNSGIKGAGTCRNIGLTHSTGNWILFADADDYFMHGFYDLVSKYFSNNYDIVYFIPQSIFLDTGLPADRHLHFANTANKYLDNQSKENELHLRYNLITPCSKLFNKKLLSQNNIIFEDVIASNDVMFSVKTGHFAKNIYVDNTNIYMITKSKGTLTANISEKVFDIRLEVICRYNSFLLENLNSRDYKIVKPLGLGFIINAFLYKYKLKKILWIINALRKNKIKIFELSIVTNPILLYKKTVKKIVLFKRSNDYNTI